MTHKRHILKNGLRVIISPMSSFESVTVMVMVGAGSRYETEKNNGISHFLEHMAFKGTTKRPTAMDIAGLIDGIGGEFNAFTGKETTGYFIKSASTHAGLCMDILSDMLLNSKFDKDEIEKEKGVIAEEINLYEDMPSRKIGDIYEELLYGDTPMGWDIAGRKEVIKGVQRDDFVNYMQSLYSSSNMTLVVSGGITESKALELAEKYFGSMPKFETIQALKLEEKQTKPEIKIKNKTTEQVHIAMGFRAIALDHPDQYPLEILASILGGGMSSRLFHEIREKRGLSYYVRCSLDQYTDAGSLVTTAGIDPKRVDEAIQVMVDQYQKVADQTLPVTEDEVRKAKEFLKGHLVLDLEDSKSVASYFASQEILEDKILDPDEMLKKIEDVTLEQVREVAKKYLVKETLNLAVIGNFTDGQKFEDLLK